MLIDILFLAMLAIAVFKGIKNGLIIAIFSIIGWILGIYAAFKFADVAMGYLKGVLDMSAKTLYILSFVIVFVIVMLLVHLGAKLVEKTVELAFMGWLNR